MNTRRLAVFAVCALAALALAPTAAAAPDVSVTVEDEPADDGETVSLDAPTVVVNVSAESDRALTSVRTETGDSFSVAGLDRPNFTTTRTLTVTGETTFTVEATDGEGTTTHEVTLRRSTGSASDAQRTLDGLQDRVDDLEGEVGELEDRRDELRETRENLSERANESEGGDADDTDGGGEGLPGFSAVAAVVALAAVGFARRF